MQHVELAVIGSGSGNMVIPDEIGEVALIECGAFGGTCVNRGCIPSKMLGYTADLAELCQRAPQFGLSATPEGVDWSSIRNRVFSRVDETSRDGHRERAASANVTVYEGHGRFAGPGELVVNDQFHISAQQVVIATGGRPNVPKVVLDSGVAFETSDTIMRLGALPASMVILGGGSVAVEMAHLFSSLGVRIHIVESAEKLLATLDAEISRRFTNEASARWNVHLDATVAEVRNDANGIGLVLEDGAANRRRDVVGGDRPSTQYRRSGVGLSWDRPQT